MMLSAARVPATCPLAPLCRLRTALNPDPQLAVYEPVQAIMSAGKARPRGMPPARCRLIPGHADPQAIIPEAGRRGLHIGI